MKNNQVLLFTNILTLTALVFMTYIYFSTRQAPDDSQPQLEMPQGVDSLIPTYYSQRISGYHRPQGNGHASDKEANPGYSDSIFIRKGEPFRFLTGLQLQPSPRELEVHPEFLGVIHESGDYLNDAPWGRHVALNQLGSLSVYTIPTDTLDMKGQKIRTLTFYPRLRYYWQEKMVEVHDTFEVHVVED